MAKIKIATGEIAAGSDSPFHVNGESVNQRNAAYKYTWRNFRLGIPVIITSGDDVVIIGHGGIPGSSLGVISAHESRTVTLIDEGGVYERAVFTVSN